MVEIKSWFERTDEESIPYIDIWVLASDTPNGRVVGRVHGFLRVTDPEQVAYVSNAWLDEDYRGRGIGKRMYKEFIDASFKAGARKVRSSYAPSVAAQRVWESLDRESEKVRKTGPLTWEAVRRRPRRSGPVSVRRHIRHVRRRA
jgi:ribosomal protein S18 acetylase RimI-like enzyme